MKFDKRIVEFLGSRPEPASTEEIRQGCKISNWTTALNRCLQLMLKGKIRGLKTSRGWVFWIDKREDSREG